MSAGRVLVVGAVWLAGAGTVAAQPAPEARFEFPAAPDFVVLEYTQRHDALAVADPTPLLRVFGDGRVRVHYPVYMKRAGDYEMQLGPGELRRLLASLQAKGLFEFSETRTRGLVAESEEQRRSAGELFERSDESHSVFSFNLQGYAPPGSLVAPTPASRSVSVADLQVRARRHPTVSALGELASAEEELRALLDDPRLSPVP